MEYNLEPLRPTKELIFSRIPEEQLMEYYLGVPVRKGLFRSPLRRDNHPTCAFYRNKSGRLLLKDFQGDFHGDAIAVVMRIFSCDFTKALQIIANDFGIITRPKLSKNKPKLEYTGNTFEQTETAVIQVQIRDFQEHELKWWAQFGISQDTLKKFKVYSCQNIFLNGNLFHLETEGQHVYGYYGGIKDGLEMWRIYFPSKKKYRFISNWKASKIQGAHMLSKSGGDYLVITKSLKDCMCLYESGIPAIAPNSENLFITDKQYQKLKQKYRKIFLFYDNDLPGITNANKIRKQYPDLKVIFIPRKYDAKDISDFRKKYGKKKTRQLINSALEYYGEQRKIEETEES